MHAHTSDSATPVQAAEKTNKRLALLKLFARIGELSTLPTIAQRVIAVADHPDSEVEDMRQIIQTDPSLVVQILRRVNSSHYGLRHQVVDLRVALNMLGLQEIRNLALSVFVSKLFREAGDHGPYNRENLWRHSQAVAHSSRMIARVTGCSQPDEAYVAGLVHDVGYILTDQHLRRYFCEILNRLTPTEPTPVTERSVLPFDHCELGAFVARKWGLSKSIADVIRHHHHPENYLGDHRDLVHVVALANFLCSRAGWSALGVHNLSSPPDEIYAQLRMDRTSLAVVWEEIQSLLASESFLT